LASAWRGQQGCHPCGRQRNDVSGARATACVYLVAVRKIDDRLCLMPLRKLRYQDRAGIMQQRAPRWALMWLEKRGLVRRVIVKSEVWWELTRRDVMVP